MTLPQVIKQFRQKYQLTQARLTLLLNQPSGSWRRWEEGTEPLPDTVKPKIKALAKRLDAILARPLRHCPHCEQDIEAWAASGQRMCMFCGRRMHLGVKARVQAALPPVYAKSGEDMDKAALRELGYDIDIIRRRKKR